MGVVRVDVAPELLRWAVRRAGWDKETALRRAPKLADWLAGASRPTLKQLEKFASDTHAPFGMLFLPEPPVETIPIPDMRTIRDAGVVEPSADLLDTVSTLGEVRWGRWCNRVAAETLVPLDSLEEQYRGSADEGELDRLARMYKVSTLVVLGRLLDAGCLTRKEYATRYDVERERVIGLARTTRDGAGGNYCNTQLRRLGRPFARAVITSTLEGRTTYRDAYRLLGARRHSTFEGLTEKVRAA